MKIKLQNENKYFFKNFILEKKTGENIILGGGDGSGRTDILLNIFEHLIETKNINKSSIIINMLGDISFFIKYLSILNRKGISDKKDFFLFNAMTRGVDDFKLFDFKNENLHNLVKHRHNLFLLPEIEKMSYRYSNYIHKKMYQFIDNLPKNNDVEIPIIIDNISHFRDEDFDNYSILMEKANKKGYFFITSTYGMFNIYNLKRNFPILQKNHKHFLIAHSQIDLNNDFVKDIKFNKKLNEINTGCFYYLKDFILQNKNLLSLKWYCFDLLTETTDFMTHKELLEQIK